MRSASPTRHLVAGIAATVGVLGMVATAVVGRTAGAGAASTAAVTSPATSELSTTTTSSTTPPTTVPPTTTVKPKPVPTTVRTTVPRAPATTAAPPTTAAPAPAPPPPVAQPSSLSAEARCANAVRWVAEHGLALPAGWGFRCPGQAIVGGTPRWGMACWNCEGNGASWIAVDIGRIGASDRALFYVVAHEICHAIDYMGLGLSSELGADLCAAGHGAPRP